MNKVGTKAAIVSGTAFRYAENVCLFLGAGLKLGNVTRSKSCLQISDVFVYGSMNKIPTEQSI